MEKSSGQCEELTFKTIIYQNRHWDQREGIMIWTLGLAHKTDQL